MLNLNTDPNAINRLKDFVSDYRNDIPDGSICDHRADRHFQDQLADNESRIKADYSNRAAKHLRKLAAKAKALSSEAREKAWARFWSLKAHYVSQGLSKNQPKIDTKERNQWLRGGLHVRNSLKTARDHAHFLLTKGLADKCIIGRLGDTGLIGIWTKQPPKDAACVIETIMPADNALAIEGYYATTDLTSKTDKEITADLKEIKARQRHATEKAPYRHGDNIMKQFGVLLAVDPHIDESYVELTIRAHTAWGVDVILAEVAPHLTLIHVEEKGADWEEDAFPADDYMGEVVGNDDDEVFVNSLADLMNPYVTAEDMHDSITQQIEDALDAARGEEQ